VVMITAIMERGPLGAEGGERRAARRPPGRRGCILVMDNSGPPITRGRAAPPTQTEIARMLRLQPDGDSRVR